MIPRLLSSAAVCLLASLWMTAAVRAADTIIIGFGGGLTGRLAYYDRQIRNGAQMAVDEINAAGGIAGKHKIDFRVRDVRSETSESAAAGREFIAAGAKVMIAPCDGDLAISFGGPANIAVLAPCASTPTLAVEAGQRVFQIYPSDNLQAAAWRNRPRAAPARPTS